MWSLVLLFALVFSIGTQAQDFNNASDSVRFSRDNFRLMGVMQVTDAEFADMKYMTYIFNVNNAGLLGTGIVYSQRWIVTPSATIDTHVASDLAVKFDARLPDNTNGLDRNVKQVVPNTDCDTTNTLVNCITLLRICPSIGADHVATLATSITNYQTVGTEVHLLTFQDFETRRSLQNKALIQALMIGKKKIGETCECDNDANFVTTKHVCLEESATVYGEDTTSSYDLKGVVITNVAHTEVAGFLVSVTSSDVGGEIALFLQDQSVFLTTNAV